jgi:phospholipase/lecithinase/hemolysin
MRNPAQYGIHDTIHACAGREIFNQPVNACATPGEYYYYHSEHPSTAVHKVVGSKLNEEIREITSKSR